MQNGVILAAQPYGLGLNETLMPQYLKELGYATHGVGKVEQFKYFLEKGDQRQLAIGSNRSQVNLHSRTGKLGDYYIVKNTVTTDLLLVGGGGRVLD